LTTCNLFTASWISSTVLELTYDFRASNLFSNEGSSEEGETWAHHNFSRRQFDLPAPSARPILVKTSSEEREAELVRVLEELGVDERGQAYSVRVEICRGPEQKGEQVLPGMEAWRRRGMDWMGRLVTEQDSSGDGDEDVEDD
jgi:hypothetical protein